MDHTRTVIVGGIIRNGSLTDAEKRHSIELGDFDSRRAVLVILPAAGRQEITPATLEEAAVELAPFLPPAKPNPGAVTIRVVDKLEGSDSA